MKSSGGTVPAQVTTTGGQFTFTLSDDKAAGAYTLDASTASGASATTSLSVTPGPAAKLTLTAASPSVAAGQSDVLTGTVTDQYGNNVADGSGVTLTSSNSTTPAQMVTTNGGSFNYTLTDDTKAGTYTVTASAGSGVTQTASVTVTPDVAAKLTLAAQNQTVQAGMADQFTGTVADQYGNPVADGTTVSLTNAAGATLGTVPTTNGTFAFTVTDDTKAGTYTLTASAGSGVTQTAPVTVTAAAPAELTLNLPAGIAKNVTTVDPFYQPAGYSFSGTLAGGSSSTLSIPSSAAVSGTVTDKFGNAIANAPVTYLQSLTGTLTTDASGNYSGTLQVNSAGAVSATVANQSLPIIAGGAPLTSVAPSGLQLHYQTGFLGIQVENGVTQTVTATAQNSQTVTFNWALRGFVGWFDTHERLTMFVNGPTGTQWTTLSDMSGVGGGFNASGTSTVTLNQGYTYGFTMFGSTYESNEYLAGTLSLTPGN